MENRREFLKSMAGITAGMMLPVGFGCSGSLSGSDKLGALLPMRKLGSTGEKVTMLGVGGYHIGWTSEKDAQEVIETAIEGGIRFFDTAHSYGPGISEERYGKFLIPKYRDHIFLMTKTTAPDAETLIKEVDLSLKRLNTDRVDLLQLHAFQNPGDVDNRITNGVMDALYSVRESGKARYIGFTGHQSPYAHLRMMERFNEFPGFSTLQMPLSIVDFASEHSFVRETLPLAVENNLGLLAMKTLADGRFFALKTRIDKVQWKTEDPAIPHRISIRDALHFAWSMPIAVLITGAENASLVREKVDLAKTYDGMSEDDRSALIAKVADLADGRVEYFKRPIDA